MRVPLHVLRNFHRIGRNPATSLGIGQQQNRPNCKKEQFLSLFYGLSLLFVSAVMSGCGNAPNEREISRVLGQTSGRPDQFCGSRS